MTIKNRPNGLLFIVNGGNDEARLGLLAVHNFYTPFLFFLRKTALRQVVHRDVTRPHFVRSSHLPKSAELAKAIFTTINSAIKKEPIKGSLLMAGTTRLSWVARVKRQFRILLFGLCPIAKLLQPLLAPRSNSGRFKTTCGEFVKWQSAWEERTQSLIIRNCRSSIAWH